MLDKFIDDSRARDFPRFFEKSLNKRANLGALQACGLQAGEHFRGVPDGTTQTRKQPSGASGRDIGNLCEEGARSRNFSHDFFKLGDRYPLPGESKEDFDRFADDWHRNAESFTDDLDDLVHASLGESRPHSSCAGTQDSLDRIGCGVTLGKLRQDDPPSAGFDDLAPTHVMRPIMPLDEHMRENRFDERARLVFVEDNDAIDGTQSGEDNGAVRFRG